MSNCPATREAVEELEAEGDTGCLICGRPSDAHRPEADRPRDRLGGSPPSEPPDPKEGK